MSQCFSVGSPQSSSILTVESPLKTSESGSELVKPPASTRSRSSSPTTLSQMQKQMKLLMEENDRLRASGATSMSCTIIPPTPVLFENIAQESGLSSSSRPESCDVSTVTDCIFIRDADSWYKVTKVVPRHPLAIVASIRIQGLTEQGRELDLMNWTTQLMMGDPFLKNLTVSNSLY